MTAWIPAQQPAPTPEVLAGGELHVAERYDAGRTVAAAQTARVLRLVREILGPDVLGAYEHGSAVLGGVQPTSDLDILVITGRPATLAEKRRLVEGLMAISAPFPPPGLERCLEVTVVAQAQVRPWRYPPSFDLQYGEWLRNRFEDGDSPALQAAVNADLTTLLTIVLPGDRPLFGPPPGALLDPVTRRRPGQGYGWQVGRKRPALAFSAANRRA